jgi:hypothetical protein
MNGGQLGAYFKPRSLTFWAGAILVVCGVFLAAEELHGLVKITGFLREIYGHTAPGVMINNGLAIIGIRRVLQ